MRASPFLAVVLILAAGSASASVVTEHEGSWRESERGKCLAENDDPSPAVLAEREGLIREHPLARVDGAIGGALGFGSPAGVGGYLGHTTQGTPASLGWSGFARVDVTEARPFWLSAQTHVHATPRVDAAAVVTDVFIGWDFHGYGNSWAVLREKRTHVPHFSCVFGRHDVALVGGVKSVLFRGDPRLPGFHAFSTGVQLRFLREMLGGTFGIDFDVLGLYDPVARGAGLELQYVLHVGALALTQNVGFLVHRGAWGTLGVGSSFEL